MDGIDPYEDAILKSELLKTELTDAEVAGILFMREEEKLARDVYLYLYEIHPLRPFLNISKSEQAHMDAIKYLIDTYGLEDPVVKMGKEYFITLNFSNFMMNSFNGSHQQGRGPQGWCSDRRSGYYGSSERIG